MNVVKQALMSLFLIIACACWKSFSPPLISVSSNMFPFDRTTAGLHVSAKVYSEKESQLYLHQNFKAKDLIPVEITIKNHTSKRYSLSPKNVSLACTSSQEIAWMHSKKRIPGSVGLKVASLFFWPLMIPSAFEGMHGLYTHRSIAKNLGAKTLQEKGEVLLPFTTTTRVLYIKKKAFTDNFSLKLQDMDSGKLTEISLKLLS